MTPFWVCVAQGSERHNDEPVAGAEEGQGRGPRAWRGEGVPHGRLLRLLPLVLGRSRHVFVSVAGRALLLLCVVVLISLICSEGSCVW